MAKHYGTCGTCGGFLPRDIRAHYCPAEAENLPGARLLSEGEMDAAVAYTRAAVAYTRAAVTRLRAQRKEASSLPEFES